MMNTKSTDSEYPTINDFIPLMMKCGFDVVDSALFFLGIDVVKLELSDKTKELVKSILEIEKKISETHNHLDRKIYNVDLELVVFLFKKSFEKDIKQYQFAADKI